MRYSSVEWTVVVPRRERRRPGPLVCSKWRLPACARKTLPLAVILKRFATDFFVLIPFGRRIIKSILLKERAIYGAPYNNARGVYEEFTRVLRRILLDLAPDQIPIRHPKLT